MNIEKSCGVSGSFGAPRYHGNDFVLLIGSKFWSPPSDTAMLTGCIQSSLCSFTEYCSFELGECSDHLHHHASWGSRGINCFRQASKSGSSFLNPFHDHKEIP
jgi:hypothetical protein